MKRLLTPRQLSDILQVSLATVYYWIHIEFVPVIRIGKCVRFDDGEIERWIKRRKNEGRLNHKIKLEIQ